WSQKPCTPCTESVTNNNNYASIPNKSGSESTNSLFSANNNYYASTQTSRGGQDRPAHEFYLQNPRSLIAPALSFHNEPQSIAQIEYKGTPEAHIFRANLHGYKKEEVKVQVEDERVLKITGEKKLIEKGYDNWHHFERKIGKFLTAFDLPQDARADKVNSSMENGVLIITVPKKGIKKPHVRTVRII
uniref:18.1 kDa class I heat shock protein-like n=1 Tax=Nicotiana tabacum TaxID=4097 RepID=A0A1S4AG79_TOBAC